MPCWLLRLGSKVSRNLSDNRISQFTPKSVKLASILENGGVPVKIEDNGIEREGEFTSDGRQKGDFPDIIAYDRIVCEVEGAGSSSKDNPERDERLRKKGYIVRHFPKSRTNTRTSSSNMSDSS